MENNPKSLPARLVSIDAYRGFVMFLMMAEVLHLAQVAKAVPDSSVLAFLGEQQTHVEWAGCSLHDLIQPSFTFLVGVALPFSLASRRGRGQKLGFMTLHAAWRALMLIFLGIFLRSIGQPRTNFTFVDTLTQIGMGYFFLFLLGLARPRWWWAALVLILVGYWAAFALYPLPGSDFDFQAAGVSPNWEYNYTGFAAHWNKNTNLAWEVDRWFLNLFDPDKPFLNNSGGYATLSFIPTLATMILGLIAGDWLRREGPGGSKLRRLVLSGVVFLAAGCACDYFGICPSVKRIWTPSWVLFSGGWCFLLLAGFYLVIDLAGFRAWAFPLIVIGMNSIAAYCMAHLFRNFILGSFKTHLATINKVFGIDVFKTWGKDYEPLVVGVAILVVYWLILFWMYRRRIFMKI
jgi:predicted acyltransferase